MIFPKDGFGKYDTSDKKVMNDLHKDGKSLENIRYRW
jgi:hypothetical protein